MSPRPSISAEGLLAQTRAELEGVERAIRAHRYLDLLTDGQVPKERLRELAGEQHAIVSSDRRSFAQLAARFPAPPAGDFFLAMAEGEGEALRRLSGFAAWLGQGDADLRSYEPRPGAQAYPAFVAWMALNGSRADVVLAFLANLAAWGENCGRVAKALRAAYGAGEDAVAFFELFATPPPGFRERALEVLERALLTGESAPLARRATRLLQAYELSFWDAMAEGL